MSTEALVHFTQRSWKEIVQKAQGKDAAKPDVVYEFSNGRKFDSTDSNSNGIYEDA
jgi:hypothetical protein